MNDANTNKNYHHLPEVSRSTEVCVGMCPYYLRDKGNGTVYCESARFRFPDKFARREIVYGFCAHPENYKKCAFKQMLDHYYERKFSMIDADEQGGMDVEKK